MQRICIILNNFLIHLKSMSFFNFFPPDFLTHKLFSLKKYSIFKYSNFFYLSYIVNVDQYSVCSTSQSHIEPSNSCGKYSVNQTLNCCDKLVGDQFTALPCTELHANIALYKILLLIELLMLKSRK